MRDPFAVIVKVVDAAVDNLARADKELSKLPGDNVKRYRADVQHALRVLAGLEPVE